MSGSDLFARETAAPTATTAPNAAADPPTETLTVGGAGKDGNFNVLSADNQPVLQTLRGSVAAVFKHIALRIGGGTVAGLVEVFDREGKARVRLNGANGSISAGAQIALQGGNSAEQIILDASSNRSNLFIGAPQRPGFIQLTTGGNPGPTVELDGERNSLLFLKKGSRTDSVVELNGNTGTVRAGGLGNDGEFLANAANGKTTVSVSAAGANVLVGGNGINGTVSVRGADGLPLLELLGRDAESAMGLGVANRPGRISIFNAKGESIRLDGATGDISLNNADCAEEFDLGVADVEPGTVLVLDDEGRLVPSSKPYDTRVAGVASGGGSFRPGLVLDHRDTGMPRAPVALMGKVYCWVDATEESVSVGDLLTTAEVPGHAMKVSDNERAMGAIIGKALAPLHSGRHLLPVLVLAG